MTKTTFRVYGLTCLLMIAAVAASATTIILPTDEQLIVKSPVIVSGTVLQSNPVQLGNKIWTETTLAVDRTFKGDASGTITIREVGGEMDGRVTRVFGAPDYAIGERVLAFLTPTPRGDFQTVDLFAGKFSEERTLAGSRIWLRDDVTADVTLVDRNFQPIKASNVQRDANGFETFVTDRVAGRQGIANYGIENVLLERDFTTSGRIKPDFTLISEPTVYRWFAFDRGSSVNWYSYGTQPGYGDGGVSEVKTAMAVWTGYGSALIRYVYAGVGTGPAAPSSQTNGINEIEFNDPNQEISGSWNPSTGGVVGLGGFNGVAGSANWTATFSADASHTQGTYRAVEIVEGFFTVQDGVSPTARVSSTTLAEICAHEFGHTLGFGHSTDTTALMYPSVTGLGPSLRPDDQLAARWLYPNGSAPAPAPTPTPTTTVPNAPSNLTAIPSGSTISLSWTDNASNESGQFIYLASGSGGFNRLGDAGPNATSGTINGASAGTYRIYVTAYNSAGESAPSNTVTVTVSGSTTPTPSPSGPIAQFTVNTSSGVAGSTTFYFTDQSSGSISSRTWNFGDGVMSAITNPAHVYPAAGMYTVTLTVSGSGGTSQAARVISVTSASPAVPSVSAVFDFTPASPNAGDAVNFMDHSSGSPTRWSWSFGDGATSTAENPSHAYAAPGTYTVTMTAFNSVSANSTTHTITVNAYAPYRSLVSASAQTSGIGGSAWRTELTVFNSGSEPATGRYLFIPGAGGSILSRQLYLGPKQSVTYANALQDLFGLSTGAGAIAIEATGAASTPTLKLTSRTYTTGSSGTYGQSVPNVAPGNLQQTLFLTGLESDADYRTNIGLVNGTGTPASATLTLYDANGVIVGSSTVIVAANNFQQSGIASYFPAAANASFKALSMRVDINAPGAVSAYASVIDNRTQDPIYIQGSALPSGFRTTIPAVGRAAGANGTFWRSDVRLFNPTVNSMAVTLRYQSLSYPVILTPNQTVVLSDVLQRFGLSSGNGALDIFWNDPAPVIASRTYTTAQGGGTYGQSIDATQSFSSDSYVPGLRSDGAFRSNVGFVNGSDSTIGVVATLLSSSGQTLASAFVPLAPRAQSQSSLAALFPGVDVSSLGTVTLQAHTDNGAVLFAYGSLVDNVSGDPVFFAGQ